MTIRFLIIDGLNLIRRIYAAMPGDDGPERADDARHSSAQSLQRALRECRPTHTVCVFEGEGPGWRHKLYDGYKAQRAPMPEALRASLPEFKAAFMDMGIPSISVPTVEADDVIATLATKTAEQQGSAIILSTDKIFLQLLSDHIIVRDHFQKQNHDRSYVAAKFGVPPERLVELLALTGDSTNNIEGIPSVGTKTAARLLAQFETLDNILSSAFVIPGKLGESLRAHGENARLSRRLSRLRRDLELGVNLKSFRYEHPADQARPDLHGRSP
jgi:protein Xni